MSDLSLSCHRCHTIPSAHSGQQLGFTRASVGSLRAAQTVGLEPRRAPDWVPQSSILRECCSVRAQHRTPRGHQEPRPGSEADTSHRL